MIKKKYFRLIGTTLSMVLAMLPCRSDATVTAPVGEEPTAGTTYYIYNVETESYLTHGGFSNTQAVIGTFNENTEHQFIASGTVSALKLQMASNSGTSKYIGYYSNNPAPFVDCASNNTLVATSVNSGEYYTLQFSGTTGYCGLLASGSVGVTYSEDYLYMNSSSTDVTTQWKFISVANIDKFRAQLNLYKQIERALSFINNATDGDAKTALTTAEAAAETSYNSSSATAADCTTATSTLEGSIVTFLKAYATAGNRMELTSYIVNPNFTRSNSHGWTYTSINYNPSNTEIEYFDSKTGLTYDYNQDVSNLPAGYYKLYVQGFQRVTVNDNSAYLSGNENIKAQLYAIDKGSSSTKYTLLKSIYDDGTGSTDIQSKTAALTKFNSNKFDNCLSFYKSTDDATMTIGVRLNEAGVVKDWTIFKNFRIYYYGNSSDAVTLNADEASSYTPASSTGAVTLNRNMKSTWSTLCVPFDVPTSDITSVFGSDVSVANLVNTTLTDHSYKLVFSTKNPVVKANVPFLIKTSTSAPAAYSTIVSADGASTVTPSSVDASLVGNYSYIDNLYNVNSAKSIFFISNGDFYLADASSTVTLKPFRAYVSAATVNNAKSCNISIDGAETTGVEGLDIDTNASSFGIYNLNGQLISRGSDTINALGKGIYIIKGKKMVIK